MPPAQVWAAASGVAAELLGVAADHGTLEGGKVGDVVVIDGAPDDLAGRRERVREVWMDGRQVSTRSADDETRSRPTGS